MVEKLIVDAANQLAAMHAAACPGGKFPPAKAIKALVRTLRDIWRYYCRMGGGRDHPHNQALWSASRFLENRTADNSLDRLAEACLDALTALRDVDRDSVRPVVVRYKGLADAMRDYR